jgi:hypothetical protein
MAGSGDRLLGALLGYRIGQWGDEQARAEPVDAEPVDAETERDRNRERIRVVQNVKARRRRRKLGALGGWRMP